MKGRKLRGLRRPAFLQDLEHHLSRRPAVRDGGDHDDDGHVAAVGPYQPALGGCCAEKVLEPIGGQQDPVDRLPGDLFSAQVQEAPNAGLAYWMTPEVSVIATPCGQLSASVARALACVPTWSIR